MHIYGPEGSRRELGMEALVENIYRMAAWHDEVKFARLDERAFDMRAHEFQAKEPEVVYDEDGVKVTSFPVPHGIYGAVGYRLDWQGLTFVFAGDCEPSSLTVENSQGADVLVTGDAKYHDARLAEELGVALIDAGHFATEKLMIGRVVKDLQLAVEKRHWDIKIEAYTGEEEPFRVY